MPVGVEIVFWRRRRPLFAGGARVFGRCGRWAAVGLLSRPWLRLQRQDAVLSYVEWEGKVVAFVAAVVVAAVAPPPYARRLAGFFHYR